jgi:hypothetical protein
LLAACDTYKPPPTAPGDSERFTLSLGVSSARADAATLVPVVVTIPNGARGDARKVTLTTNLGSFPAGDGRTVTVVSDRTGTARADLRAPVEAGVARVRAVAAGAIRDDSIRFVAALPERIEVDAPSFTLKAGFANSIAVTVHLIRSVGKVTPGARVEIFGVQPDGTRFGQVSVATPSNADGIVTARFTAGDTSYRGPFTLRARLVEPSGSTVTGSTMLQLVD